MRKTPTPQHGCRAGVLFLPVFAEIHPLSERMLALAVALIQIQVAVWIVELEDFLRLLIEIGVNSSADLVEKRAAGQKFCLPTMDNELLKEICFFQKIPTFPVGISSKDCIVFSGELIYFFLVLRVVCEDHIVGFDWRSSLHLLVSSKNSPRKTTGKGALRSARSFAAFGIVFLPLLGNITLLSLPAAKSWMAVQSLLNRS